jgi:hypothetical protein
MGEIVVWSAPSTVIRIYMKFADYESVCLSSCPDTKISKTLLVNYASQYYLSRVC